MYKMKLMIKTIFFIIILNLLMFDNLKAEVLKEFKVKGNQRISNETIRVFAEIKINEDYNQKRLNKIDS